jgi:hypothetical protein
MYGDWFDIARILIALLTTGSVVKLMDDALDTEFDLCLGKRTLAAKMGRATLPYCLVLVLIGAAANLHVSISIFLASYAVGMFHHLEERLPTRLPAYVECLGAFLLSALLTGWIATLWALCMMCVIDWLDDVVDSVQDKESGQSNMTVRFGVAEVLFGILLVLFGAIWLEAWWTAYAFVTLAILTIFFELTTTQILET